MNQDIIIKTSIFLFISIIVLWISTRFALLDKSVKKYLPFIIIGFLFVFKVGVTFFCFEIFYVLLFSNVMFLIMVFWIFINLWRNTK